MIVETYIFLGLLVAFVGTGVAYECRDLQLRSQARPDLSGAPRSMASADRWRTRVVPADAGVSGDTKTTGFVGPRFCKVSY